METLAVDNKDVATTQKAVAGKPGIQTLRVDRKEIVADGIVRLRLVEPNGERVPFWTPGAHIEVVVPQADGEALSRHYSLCGDRWDPHAYEIAILNDPKSKGGSKYVHEELAVGDMVTVGTPRNNFPLSQAKHFEFIAGGIGITPILKMIEAAEQLGASWHLNYGGRSTDSMAFLDTLAEYGDKVTLWPQDEKGFMDLSYLCEPVEDGRVYCCGPEPLLNVVQKAAENWPSWAVRFERFVPATLPAPVRTEPFMLDLARSKKCVEVGTNQSVLAALTDAGVPVLSSCNEGVCGTCEVAVLKGKPEHRDSLLNDAEREKNDRMFVCVSRAVSDRLELDL